MAKTKDLFLNMVANPDMTLEDLASVGLTSENTMLLDRAQYASNEKVQDMFKDSEGNFDEQKFNTWYDLAEQSYNILANDEANLNLMDVTAYDSDNIFVDPSKRKAKNEPIAVKLPNPDRLNVGITRIGKIGPRTLSQDEIAQTQKVLLNPTDVTNGADPIYGSAPNDSWFEDFWDTRVMAAWDEDGTHTDPITGKEVQHKKGDLKLNENGTYYYESLDGRSVYGKRILNKFNTLTTDGSAWNKYDFFDSDSIEQKSIGGSIAKNLALVGSMFIPYVGWGVAAASVAHQSAGLFATLGKMLAGSDSPTLDAIEGWVKSVDRRNLKTEYAQQNMWCWENFIDLIGDTTAQLREQRAIFKFAPGIIKRDFKALSEKAMKEYGEKLAKEGLENATSLSFRDLYKLAAKKGNGDPSKIWEPMMSGAKDIFSEKAQKAVRKYLDDYYKLGEPIAKAYMTAITVQDTFGEAIQAGATDGEATLLTLGYAAAEAALLSTDLGKWIMPELRTNRLRNKMIAKKLFELPEETRTLSKQLTKLDGETKKAWAKRLFNVGRDIARAEYSMMPTTLGTIAAQGLGEGVEEVSEEALADFSKSCFNLVQQLQGDDVRMNAWNHNWDWSEAANRYGMSFLGGIMGGSINAAASDYKANRDILSMNSQQAMQQLIYMARNNELDDFWKTINKTTLAPKELSTHLNDNGIGYKPGTKEDNQDLAAKRALKKQVDLITSILNAENAKLDDDGLIAALTQADPSLKELDPVKEYRMRALANSATAGRFLNEWNTIDSDIVKNRIEQQKILSKYGDKSSDMSKEDEESLKDLGKKLKVLQQRKEAMLDGTRTREYVRDALFEMSHPVKEVFDDWATLIRYSEAMTGKKFSDISEDRKAELKDQYEKVKGSNQYAEKVHMLADIYETMATTASQGIQASADYYEKIKNDSYQNIVTLNKLTNSRLSRLIRYTQDKDKGIINIQRTLGNNYVDSLMALFADDDAYTQGLQQEKDLIEQEIASIRGNKTDDQLTPQELAIITDIENHTEERLKEYTIKALFEPVLKVADEFIQLGFAHPETKFALETLFNDLKTSSEQFYKKYDKERDQISWDLADLFDSYVDPLGSKLQEIKKLSNTPILENLKQFQISTDTDKSVLDLIEYLHNKENIEKKDISSFTLETATKQQFEDARKLLTMYRSAIAGARFDNIDIDNIVGFNTTLNELSGANEGVKLAEIDGQTADLLLEDINVLLKRLDFAERLHNLNKGNKYNAQSKTSLNKNYILFNKIKSFISILEDDDEWKDQNGQTSLQVLLEARNKATNLAKYSGFDKPYDSRIFAITPEEKDAIESELIDIQVALHNFFKDRIDGSDVSIDKLAKILTYDNFKGLIRENNDFLDSESVDIDDSAFIWWLCSTAALDPTQFNVNYNAIVGQEREGERPIAPIPTQELGVFALTAAIVNGDMFKTFGKALRKSLFDFWDSKSENERSEIYDLYGGSGILFKDSSKKLFKNNDFLPNFENIIFIEGIAGSGKSTGVLKTLSRILSNSNPDFVQNKVIFAHTDKTKGETLGNSTDFKNFEAHDHDSLLRYMSSDYNSPTVENDTAVYEMDKDVKLVEGFLRAPWKVNQYNPDEVPKIIFIDEWSHYNQIEQDLIQRFAQEYGVTVIAMGDYDQLTPKAKITFKDGTQDITVTPSRNMTPRVAKLGVSMRTDNDIKTGNIYRMLAWRKNPTDSVQLHYYEDETGIYGDKQYVASTTYDKATLDKIKLDVQKMISTLKDGEKIGYIYHKQESELYKWLTEDPDISQHIVPYQEKDAHGREAQYYIVENNREGGQDALDYFESAYTGITRSEQGSLIITNSGAIKNSNMPSKFNEKGLAFTSVQDSEMLPDTYTDEGTRNFTKQRKRALDKKYSGQQVTPFDIKPRTREGVIIDQGQTDPSQTATPNNPNPNNPNPGPAPGNSPSPSGVNPPPLTEADAGLPPLPPDFDYDAWVAMNNPKNPTQPGNNSTESTTSPDGGLPPLPPEGATIQTPPLQGPGAQQQNLEPSFEEFGGTRIPDDFDRSELFTQADENWQGSLPKGQKLYMSDGRVAAIVVGEHGNYYSLYYPMDNRTEDELKDVTEELYFTNKPNTEPILKKGTVIAHKNYQDTVVIDDVFLMDYKGNVVWGYSIEGLNIKAPEPELSEFIKRGIITIVNDQNQDTEEVPDNEYETEGAKEWQETADSQFSQREPSAAVQTRTGDIYFNPLGFTFNNAYLADEFDDNGNIVINQRDRLRIDNGYGLFKLNPNKYRNKADIEEALGTIRRHLEFSSNQEIISTIQRLSGEGNLDIKWGFVSKTLEDNNGPYARYNAPLTSPMYMPDEDSGYLVNKTLSAIIYKDNVPILELPIITLQSPHSIFLDMREKGIGQDVWSLWKFGNKEEKETLNCLTNIIAHIRANHKNHRGYQNLANYIKLWLFTSNGFQTLFAGRGKEWNLHEQCKNKGNLYITHKLSDNGEFNYEGKWVDLTSLNRKDRFISSIMINKTDTINDPITQQSISIFRKYTPYVLISDDPNINTDEEAAEQYLKQQTDPNEEQRVKAVPVVPPEMSVEFYINAMKQVFEGDTNQPYGNKYSSYRIWSAILNPEFNREPFNYKGTQYRSRADFIMSQLSPQRRSEVISYIKQLKAIEEQVKSQVIPNESKIAYKRRLANALNTVLNNENDSPKVYAKLRSALVDCCKYNAVGETNVLKDAILAEIVSMTKQAKITGILCHPKLAKDQAGLAIGGFAYKVETEDKFKFPGHGSYRIFGKIDTPTYQLSSLWWNFARMSYNAKPYKEFMEDGQKQRIDGIWSFDGFDELIYLEGITHKTESPKLDLTNVRKYYKNLLATLEMDQYNVDESELEQCKTESEALYMVINKISMEYVNKNPSTFCIFDNIAKKVRFGKLGDDIPEYANLRFRQYQLNADGTYSLYFNNNETGTVDVLKIEVLPDNKFQIRPPKPSTNNSSKTTNTLNVAELKDRVSSNFAQSFLNGEQDLINNLLACYDVENNRVDTATIEALLINSGLDEWSLEGFRNTLELDSINQTQSEQIQEEQNQDVCVNPIKISFK